MKNYSSAIRSFLLCLFITSQPSFAGAKELQQPPKAAEIVVEETICDTTIADPFRYMENLENPVVKEWFRGQATYAQSMLQRIAGREELIEKMQEFDQRKKEKVYNLTISESNRYFYLKRSPSDETGKLFYRNGFKGKEHLLFDPETYASKPEIRYSIGKIAPSDDGETIVFSVAANGSENATLLIMDVTTAELYPEKIERCRFASPSWLPDGSGFLYNRMRSGEVRSMDVQMDSKIYLHRVGSDPALDREIFSRATNPDLRIRQEDIPGMYYDKNSGCLFAFVHNVDQRMTVYYAPADSLRSSSIPWKPLFMPEDNVYDFEITDNDLYILTPQDAPNFKVIRTSLHEPDIRHAQTVIAETPDAVLTGFSLTSEGIYYSLSRNGVQAEVYRKDFNGEHHERLKLPFAAGTAAVSTRGFRFKDVWVLAAGWANDYKRYRYDADRKRFIKETLSSTARYPEYDDLVVEELMIPSHDGVEVPISLIYKKGLKKDGTNPLLFYGYGAYGNAITPFFSPAFLLWTYHGGIFAVAHVRGGGELGDQWHKDGMKTTKSNTWLDLISLAEYSIRQGYSSPEHIAVNSASAGGILVGRAMTQRPELFAAVIPQVGAMNPLRGENTPNGPVNAPEFGTVNNPLECRALITMDPYLNIRKGIDYPAALITAGINDPRVIAWQPAKFAARLQAATTSGKPVLFLTDYQAGHGMGNTKTKQFETLADVLSFAFWQTGQEDFQPSSTTK